MSTETVVRLDLTLDQIKLLEDAVEVMIGDTRLYTPEMAKWDDLQELISNAKERGRISAYTRREELYGK